MVQIAAPYLEYDNDDVVVIAPLSDIQPSGKLRFRLPAAYAPTAEAMADAVFPIGLLLAMVTNQKLVLEAPVSQKLLENAEIIQDIYCSWRPKKMRRVEIKAEGRNYRPIQKERLTLSTFTGGVDAFYTLDKHQSEISTLFYGHGFDAPLKDTRLRELMSKHLSAAARDAGKTLVQPVSNIRRFINPHVSWSKTAHGAVISGVAMLLSSTHEKFYFPSSYEYSDLYAWGSHPLTDPLWSTEYLQVIHDGAEASRVMKTRKIAHNPAAQKHLRVCFQKNTDYNCGRCSKCLRTKIALRLEGCLEQFETLDHEVDLQRLEELGIKSNSDLIFARENYEFAQEVGDAEIEATLGKIMKRYESKMTIKA